MADSRLKIVNRVINQAFKKYFNPDDVVNDGNYYINSNSNTTWRQYLLFNLRHTFGLMQNSDVKYLPIVARLAYSDEVRFDITDDNGEEINTLKRIISQLKKDDSFFNEVKNNPNITFSLLSKRFKDTFAQEDEADAEAANTINDRQSDYIVKELSDFNDAKYYHDYLCSNSKLCYMQNERTWNDYTKNGINKVYVCLRKGWEDIPEEPKEGNPYDLYGTSMIFVIINPKGNIVTSNCRWNHHTEGSYNGDVDHAFTKTTLSQTIGMPFDSVFKGKKTSLKELIENGCNDLLNDIATGDFVIPNDVTSIDSSAFVNCTSLTSITIPDSVTSIGDSAFHNCSSLTSVTIGSGVTSIGVGAFCNCRGLTSVTIPDSVTEIGIGAFYGCKSLTSIVISNSVSNIGSQAFGDTAWYDNQPDGLVYAGKVAYKYKGTMPANTSIELKEGTLGIADSAFYRCSNLTAITIPNSVKNIGWSAFSDCSGLTAITIGNGVKSIGGYAFQGSGLTSIEIPNSVTNIGKFAFACCDKLTSITIPDSVTNIGRGVFIDCDNLTVNYPQAE